MCWPSRHKASCRNVPFDIVAGQKEAVALWMLAKLPGLTELPGGFEAIGVARDGVLVGGCIYTDYRPCPGGGNVVIWAAGHGWLSRRVIDVMLGYPFRQLNCHRITAMTAKGNKPSRRLLEKLGFREEGKIRRGFDVRQDMLIFGMLRDEQGWI